MKGDMFRYFIPEGGAGTLSRSTIAFLAANYTGMVATLLLVLLLAISNDVSLRALGPARWKSIQRLNYVLSALVVIHGALYLAIGKLSLILIATFIVIVIFVVQVQIGGRALRR
jgi:DMSO/TMAO reductase YedYZ heme-binding membrane subunit